MLRNPNYLHWLPDPEQAGKQVLYVGPMGLPAGMPSKRGIKKSSKNLQQIVQKASVQGKMGNLQRAFDRARASDDFDSVYKEVFGPGSAEAEDLDIFDLNVGEVRRLPNYREIVLPPASRVGSSLPRERLARHAIEASDRDLKHIVEAASKQDKIGNLRHALGEAQGDTDFDGVYEAVFGAGSSEKSDLAIFDLTVGEVRCLSNYSELFDAVDDDTLFDQECMPKGSAVQTMYPEGLIKHLQERYKQDNKLPPLLDDKAQSLEGYYLRLVMRTIEETKQKQVKKQSQQALEEQDPDDLQPDSEPWQASLDYKLLYEVKKSIEVEKLWERDLGVAEEELSKAEHKSESEAKPFLPAREPRHCCILGQAGSGKTTMTCYITYQWAKGNLWRDRFAWIMRLPLRWVHMLGERESVSELLARQWGCHVKDLELLFKQPKGLIILDGWDEVVEIVKEDHPLQRFLEKYSSQGGISWLTTSRPYASLPTHIGVDRQCDLIGFQQEDVATYVKKYFRQEPKSGQELLKYLEGTPELRLLSQVPLYTRFLCLLKHKASGLFTQGEKLSVSHLYHKLLCSFLRYCMGKRYGVAKVKHRTDRWLDGACTSMYAYLGELAFRGLAERQILISPQLQNSVESSVELVYRPEIHAPSYRHQALSAGLLQALGEGNTPVHFPHLSLQEWFAAYHMAQSLYAPTHERVYKRACRVLQQRKYDVRYRQVLPLTAGLLYQQYVDGEDDQAYGLHLFWHHVLSDPQELVGIHQVVLNMRCMEACSADTRGVLGKLHKPILDDITSWLLAAWDVRFDVDYWGKPVTTVPLLPLLEPVCPTCLHVLAYRPLVEGVLMKLGKWKKLPQLSEQVALGTLRTLTRLFSGAWPLPVQEALSDYALLGCQHTSWRVRQGEACALSKMLQSPCSNVRQRAIMASLTGLCKDDVEWVRKAAAEALARVLKSVCSAARWQTIILYLTSLCKDEERWVRQAAAAGLSQALEGACSQERWHTRVATLRNLCQDDSEWVRRAATVSLSKGLEGTYAEASRQGILKSLKALCRDKCDHVRSAAAKGLSKALGVVSSDEAWQDILEILKALCRDKSDHVRSEAAAGLSKALEDPCSDDAWQAIVASLRALCHDNRYHVLSEAALGLSKALEGPCSEEAWQARLEVLRDLCEDQQGWVRYGAAKSLLKGLEGRYAEEFWEVRIEALMVLCEDSNNSVRRKGVEGVVKILERQCTEETKQVRLKKFTSLCQHAQAIVRCSAAWGLSQTLEGVDSETGQQAILKTLRALCQDEHCSVRSAALGGLSKALASGWSKPSWQAILATLTYLCRDKVCLVRKAAAEGLSQALKSNPSEEGWQGIVASLASLCQDRDSDVRKAAASGLSKSLESPCSEEHWRARIATLRGLCMNHDARVRVAVAAAWPKGLTRKCSQETWQAMLVTLINLLQDSDSDVRRAADQALVEAMRQKELLAQILIDQDGQMRAQKPSQAFYKHFLWCSKPKSRAKKATPPALIKVIVTHSPCLVLPATCDAQVSRRIKAHFAEERKVRGWPVKRDALKIFKQAPLSRPDLKVYPEVMQLCETRYHAAARKNDLIALTSCYRDGLDINDQHNKSGKTPLMIALEANHRAATQWLLKHGAWIDVADKHHQARSTLEFGQSWLILKLLPGRGMFPMERITGMISKVQNRLNAFQGNVSDVRYRELLHKAVGALVGSSPSELKTLIGQHHMWYEGLLSNRTFSLFEHLVGHEASLRQVQHDGGPVDTFLTLRIYIMIEILVDLSKKRLPPGIERYQAREALLRELQIGLTTFWDNRACWDFEETSIPNREWIEEFVKGLVKRFEDADTQEVRLALGYIFSKNWTGHCIYTTLTKREGHFVVRNDNRGYGEERHAEHVLQEGYVRPYLVAHFPWKDYDQHKGWLTRYLVGALKNYFDYEDKSVAIDHLYQEGQSAPGHKDEEKLGSAWTDWPYRPTQTSARNCIMRSHNVGCRIGLGEKLYVWFRKQESCSPLLEKRFVDEA